MATGYGRERQGDLKWTNRNGNIYYILRQLAATIVILTASIIRMNPTDYGVLERLANSGYIGKKDTLVDYGSGKGRVSFFLAYQTRCQAIGVEYDRRLWEKDLANGQTAASRRRVTFVLADAVEYEIPPLFAGDDDREKILVLRLRD